MSPFVPQFGDHDDLRDEARPTKAIGWLGRSVSFAKGQTPDALVGRLRQAARTPNNLTRGWQPCPFCGFGRDGPPYEQDQMGTVYLGNGEIHVDAGDVVYVAPTLIIHYVDRHRYLSPADFIDAVLGR